ncbi:MAG TPA: ABC transporter ATP-binding protein [Candidatus Paceibacterota bacterium]|nr:ABC transporter ATP-binding protein [Candidatus Paceibacterota bacterium]
MAIAIEVSGIKKTFRDSITGGKALLALEDISFEVTVGEFFILIGPSGSGKSTLLRIMSGFLKPDHGKTKFGEDLSHSDISFVFQQFALLPWLNVFENVELGLIARRIPVSQRIKMVEKELKEFGLQDFAKAYPRELSGGMRQRVGLARAFVTSPKIIFMDEPFSELDSFTAQVLRQDLLEIWRDRQPTIVMVTHITEEALLLGDRIAVMSDRPGSIKKIVKNSLPRPRKIRSQEFFAMEDELQRLIVP